MVAIAATLERVKDEQLVVFTLHNESYGVSIETVNTIIRLPEITSVPHAAGYVKGVINLRGLIVPVISLRTRFGLPEHVSTKETRVIVVENHGTMVGMIVDAVTETLSLAGANIDPLPPMVMSVDAQYLRGVGKFGGRLIILLDLEKALQREEIEALTTLCEPAETADR